MQRTTFFTDAWHHVVLFAQSSPGSTDNREIGELVGYVLIAVFVLGALWKMLNRDQRAEARPVWAVLR